MLTLLFEIFFWFSVTLILYTYAGYPFLLMLAARSFSKKVQKAHFEPKVSVIMSAFNEERHIEEKLHNLLMLDYPADKLEILIGSDGGSDKTDEIISKFPDARIRFFRFVSNLGKPHVLNGLINESRGAILVFTDARQRFDSGAVRELVENFADPEVGCVSGELYFETAKGSGAAKGMDAYWRYEKFLRKKESGIGSMLGATGAIYAIRRRLFKPMPREILVDDMYTPLAIVLSGYRAVFDSGAKAYDFVSQKGAQEFTRKVRTLLGNYQIVQHFPELLDPRRSPVAWQFLSHKILRLAVPLLMISAFVSNLFLPGGFYRSLLVLQGVFYGAAGFELMLERLAPGKRGPGYIPYMFCVLNYSAFVAFVRFVRGDMRGVWQKAYASDLQNSGSLRNL